MLRRIIKFFITFFYKLKNRHKCKMNLFSNEVLRGSVFEGKNVLGKGTYFSKSLLGYGSFIGNYSEISETKIGKYCSIGHHVRIISATHPLGNFVSTHPAFYSNSYFFSYSKDFKFKEHLKTNNGYECEIGNDVWIGDNVLIKGGVKIGDGAVLGMGSVVVKDVPPYSIVGGVPAKIIKLRFNKDIIQQLEEFQWWNKSEYWIKKNSNYFKNIEKFLNKIDLERKEK